MRKTFGYVGALVLALVALVLAHSIGDPFVGMDGVVLAAPHIIFLRGVGQKFTKEALAATGSSILPGHLVERSSETEVQEHSTAAGNAAPLFADIAGEIGDDIDTAYAVGDQVKMIFAKPGDEIYALVAAGASAISVGDALESAGDGTLRVQSANAATDATERDSVVAYAIEAVDNSGGGSVARIKVEVA